MSTAVSWVWSQVSIEMYEWMKVYLGAGGAHNKLSETEG